jgi:hypothetical protein
MIKGVNNDAKKKAETKDGKTYTVSDLGQGTYQIVIKAYDYAENFQEFEFVRKLTSGATPAQKLTETMKGQTYEIIGSFVAHDFGGKAEANWAFMKDGKVSKFTGASKDGKMPFGLEDADVKITAKPTWYLAKMSNVEGKFAYAVVNKNMTVIKKVESVNADGSLNYLQASSMKASMSKDGKKVSFK